MSNYDEVKKILKKQDCYSVNGEPQNLKRVHYRRKSRNYLSL